MSNGVLACVLTLSSTAIADDPQNVLADFTIASWGLSDGLPSSRIWSIAEDASGYLWLGTDAGLVRFDGVRFRRWTPVTGPDIQRGAVLKVFSARDGSVWLGQGPAGDGVSRVADGHVVNYGRPGLTDSAINLLLEDRRGGVWAGNDDGLYQLERNHWNQLTPADGVPRAAVFGGYEDRSGDLWIGTSKGILLRRNGTHRFELVDPDRQTVQGFTQDSSGTIWLTDPVYGFRTAGAVVSLRHRPTGSGNQVLYDSRGDLWVATVDRGLWRVRRDGGKLEVSPITAATKWPNDVLRALHEDRDGNIWVGADSGLYRFTPRRVTALTHVGRSRLVATTPDGSTWVGTADGLVRVRNNRLRSYGHEQGLPGSGVTALTADRSGTLWVATATGIGRLLDHRIVPLQLPPQGHLSNIRALGAVSDGTLWIYDNDEGMFEWRQNRLVPFTPPPQLRGHRVRFLYVDREDRLWLSFTRGNILIVTPDGKWELRRLPDEHTLINAIYEDRDGTIWLGGTQGLTRIENQRMTTVPQAKLPGYAVFSIVEDDERNLWIGGALGIVRMSQKEFDLAVDRPDYQPHYELYDASDGLAGMPLWFGAAVSVQSEGKLSFVTTGGITVVDPRERNLKSVPLNVRIDNVMANGRPVAIGEGLRFPPQVRNLIVEYTVPSLTSPTKVTFRHRLKNVESDWIDTGSRRDVSYANLPPGSYSFDVMAVSSDHGWNESSASWNFSIRPMFYQTAWFYSLILFTLAALAALLWRLRLRHLRRQFSLVLAERARMSREIHDTLLQGMVGAALQFDMLSEMVRHSSPALVEHLVRVRKQLEEYIRETREAIFDLRVPRSERSVVELIREAGARIAAGSGVRLDVAVSGTARPLGVSVDRQLLHVAREAITNAIRHGKAHRIEVIVDYRSDSILLRVSDDGQGFDVEQTTRQPDGHFGLQTMEERAQQVNGRIRIKSSIGMGTDIEVAVPTPAEI